MPLHPDRATTKQAAPPPPTRLPTRAAKLATAMKRAVLIGFAAAALMLAGDPRLEPLTGLPPFPADNPPTPEKIRLGKELFFDEILSGGRRSCSTCHKPELYFTDGFSRAWAANSPAAFVCAAYMRRRSTPTV